MRTCQRIDIFRNVFRAKGSRAKKGKYKPGAQDIEPEIPGLELENDIADAEDAPAEAFLQGNPTALSISIQGTVEKGNEFFPYSGVIAIWPGWNELRKKLIVLGIRIAGQAADIENADSAILLSKKTGKRLLQLIRLPLPHW